MRFNIGQLNGGTLQALRINGIDEPDAVAINNGFAPAGSYDDDNNNFVNATLDSVGPPTPNSGATRVQTPPPFGRQPA